MLSAIELQVISKLIISEDTKEIEALLSYDADDYFPQYNEQYKFIQKHYNQYNSTPSKFEFLMQFGDIVVLEDVKESVSYLQKQLVEYRKYIILLNMFNKIKDLGQGDINDAWAYISTQLDEINNYQDILPDELIKGAEERAEQVRLFAKQKRIPTGFPEIDKALYGGWSTVEELVVLVARTNAGKSWIAIRFMEAAQSAGFPVAYYSPEMMAAYVGTRFDTWRGHFENNRLYRGDYSDEYVNYAHNLTNETVPAYVLEDKHFPNGASVRSLSQFVSSNGIKLLIVDGISYLNDDKKAVRDQEKFKNIALGLFQLSKRYGCAVIIVMQSNREVRSKDGDTESIPDLFNTEGSDQPGRIATQALGIRYTPKENKLELKLIKSRNASKQNSLFAYNWAINEGRLSYIESEGSESDSSNVVNDKPGSFKPISFGNNGPDANDLSLITPPEDAPENEYEGIEF